MYPEQINNNYEGDGVFLYGLQGTSFYKETKENKVMKQYINKSALIAEIERRIKTNKECMLGLRNLDYYQGKVDALNDTISFISTLEVKDVDSADTFINKACEFLSNSSNYNEGFILPFT